MKLSQIKKNPNNPRVIKDNKFEQLKRSLSEFPKMLDLRPIIVDDNDVVLGGNMRLTALKDLGYKEIPDSWIRRASELTLDEQRRFIITDNASFGEWDWDLLASDWDADELAAWGLDLPGIIDVTQTEVTEDTAPALDQAEELNRKWQVKIDDLWQIGRHRLLCGDSTSAESYARLLNDRRADICITSPPYNVGDNATLNNSTHAVKTKYINAGSDDLSTENYSNLLDSFTKRALEYADFAFVNLQMVAGNKLALVDYLSLNREHLADILIWDKETAAPAMAERVMNSQFEFVFILASQEFPSRAIGKREFRGTVSNVYRGAQQRNNEFADSHAATFPLHLPAWLIKTFTDEKQIVLDPFGGTGTTLLACEQLNRECRMIELEPKYCAIILERLTKLGLATKRID